MAKEGLQPIERPGTSLLGRAAAAAAALVRRMLVAE